MRKKKADPNKAAKEFLGKIVAIFHVSQSERQIYRVKMEKSGLPNFFICQVSFLPTGGEFYHKTCADPCHFATSEKLLRSNDKQIRNLNGIMERMAYFETTAFPEDVMEQTHQLMQAIRMKDYQVLKTENSLEIIRVTPAICEKKEA